LADGLLQRKAFNKSDWKCLGSDAPTCEG